MEPLLAEPWILDVDTTIKPLYGHQEGAALGYNPKKPRRPSHCYHTYSMASTRLILDVDVSPGDEHASRHCAPSLWALIDRQRYESCTPPIGWDAYAPGLKRIGIQNWRRASTAAGMWRQSFRASGGVLGLRVVVVSAGRPASSTQWIRIGRS